MMQQIMLVGLGGAIGSILRYLISVLTLKYYTSAFPLATFVVNILGCLLIGLFMGYIERNQSISPDLRFLLITGFCGGYTTFSTFASENLTLLQTGNYVIGLIYISASIVIGIIAVWLGLILTKI